MLVVFDQLGAEVEEAVKHWWRHLTGLGMNQH